MGRCHDREQTGVGFLVGVRVFLCAPFLNNRFPNTGAAHLSTCIFYHLSFIFRCGSGIGGPHHLNCTTTEHSSIRLHLTVACHWQLCLFRQRTYDESTAQGEMLQEGAHRSDMTTTVQPMHTPQSAHTSQYHALGSSACFDAGCTAVAQRRQHSQMHIYAAP